MAQSKSAKTGLKFTGLKFIVLIVVLLVVLGWFFGRGFLDKPAVSAITRDGVITEIQELNRLTTVTFSIDTVITSQKQGSWYKLWQDEQKGLFVAHGRVLAGVDLAKLSPEQVQVSYAEQTDPKIAPQAHIDITLPPSQIFEVFLDDIQVYDWKTGLFGIAKNDPEILNQAQVQAKQEVLQKACQGGVMTLAKDNAKKHIEGLFMLAGATVSVKADAGACKVS